MLHNTIVQTPSETGRPSALYLRLASTHGFVARGNVLVTTGAVPLVTHKPGQRGVDLAGNVWAADTLVAEWDGEPVRLGAWRAASGLADLAVLPLGALELAGAGRRQRPSTPSARSPALRWSTPPARMTGRRATSWGRPCPRARRRTRGAVERRPDEP